MDLDYAAELFPDDGVVSRARTEASVRKPSGQTVSVNIILCWLVFDAILIRLACLKLCIAQAMTPCPFVTCINFPCFLNVFIEKAS